MKTNKKLIMLLFAAGFFLLFVFRLIYGFTAGTTSAPVNLQVDNMAYNQSMGEKGLRNYASFSIKQKAGSQTVTVDQKYEKIATVNARTNRFEEEEKRLRKTIQDYQALIQYERNNGLKGSRSLELAIGVHPDRFDAMVAAIKQIGVITSMNINKTDKTNEYKELKAQRISLEATRNALLALKYRSGNIDEFVKLENRILEIEEKIQSLGVELGEFDAENEFCTINFSLVEARLMKQSFMYVITQSLEWTIGYYLMLCAIAFFTALAALVIVNLLEKLRVLPQAVSK